VRLAIAPRVESAPRAAPVEHDRAERAPSVESPEGYAVRLAIVPRVESAPRAAPVEHDRAERAPSVESTPRAAPSAPQGFRP